MLVFNVVGWLDAAAVFTFGKINSVFEISMVMLVRKLDVDLGVDATVIVVPMVMSMRQSNVNLSIGVVMTVISVAEVEFSALYG